MFCKHRLETECFIVKLLTVGLWECDQTNMIYEILTLNPLVSDNDFVIAYGMLKKILGFIAAAFAASHH